MNRLINPLVLCAALFAVMSASGQTTKNAPSAFSHDSNVTSFAKKFNPLHSKILDEGTQFSGSQMFTDLVALEPLAASIGVQSAELTNLYSMLSLLQLKRRLTEPAARYGELAVKINTTSKALPLDEVVLLHNRLRKIYEDDDDFKRALPHAQSAVALSANDKSLTATQRLGLRESLGYLQHETGQYVHAIETNRTTLLDAEKIYRIDDIELTTVLTNIAQNLHASKNPAAARPYLERVLKIARKHNDVQREFNMLFQLGVLAYEERNEALAKRYFEDCMRVANKANDDDMRASARGHLKQLAEKKRPQRKQ
jgi:tetratricopeptide (TPR) repeat protein